MTCSFSTVNLLSRDKDLRAVRGDLQGGTGIMAYLIMHQSIGCSLSLSTDSISMSACRINRYVIARQYFVLLSPRQGKTLDHGI